MTDLRLRLMLVAAPSRAAMQAALLGYQIMAPRLTRTTIATTPMEMILR